MGSGRNSWLFESYFRACIRCESLC